MSAPGELRGDEPGLCDGVGGEVYNPEAVTRAGRAASLGKNPERENPERGAEVFEAFGARCSRARNGRGKNRGVRGRRAEPCRRKAACGGAYPGKAILYRPRLSSSFFRILFYIFCFQA